MTCIPVRMMSLAVAIVFACGSFYAAAHAYDNETGYRDCSLGRLDACDNSNQLFWGPSVKLKAPRKRATDRAITAFLAGAPPLVFRHHRIEAASTAIDALTGPGEKHRFPSGEYFFSGFTPHYAPDQAAVIFDGRGKILIVATLLHRLNDAQGLTGNFDLTIYARSSGDRKDLVGYIQNWGRNNVSGKSPYPGLPKDVFGESILLVAGKGSQHWRRVPIP